MGGSSLFFSKKSRNKKGDKNTKRKVFRALTGPGLLITLILVLSACPGPATPGGDTVVNVFSMDGKVTAPVRGAAPVTAAVDTVQYTGTVVWQKADGTAHTGAFAASVEWLRDARTSRIGNMILNGFGAITSVPLARIKDL
jgi:hypothetical protein